MKHKRGVDAEFAFLEPRERRAARHLCPGILVFSHRGQLLYLNRRALKMTGHLGQVETGPFTTSRTRQVIELRGQIRQTLTSRMTANVWDPFELKRVIFEPGQKILLRGVGLPNRNASNHSHIIITLEEVRLRHEHRAQQAQVQVQPAESRRVVVPEPATLVGQGIAASALVIRATSGTIH